MEYTLSQHPVDQATNAHSRVGAILMEIRNVPKELCDQTAEKIDGKQCCHQLNLSEHFLPLRKCGEQCSNRKYSPTLVVSCTSPSREEFVFSCTVYAIMQNANQLV